MNDAMRMHETERKQHKGVIHTFDTNKVELTNFDFDDEVGYSDELDTLGGNEDEGPPKVIFPCFKVPENDEDMKFDVGLQFSSKKQILEEAL